MVEIGRVLEIRQVTRDASSRGQVVVIVDVAIGTETRGHCVGARQREVHHRVIEGRRRPGNRGMALRAVRGEVCRHVVGIRRTLKIFQVAGNAGRAGQVVVVVGVAVDALAWRNGVSAGQRKSYGAVIKFCVQPIVRAVAGLAGDGELGRHVARVRGRSVVRRVAGIALR